MKTADALVSAAEVLCPNCRQSFRRQRKDQNYCSSKCRKSAHKRKDRAASPSNAKHSPDKRRQQMVKFDKAIRLAEMYYTMPPCQRLGFLEELVQLARSGEAPLLRDILCSPNLLKPDESKKHLFFCYSPKRYKTISQLVDLYCRLSPWRSSLIDVVRRHVPEPATGEVSEDGAFYDGPGFDPSMQKTSTPYLKGPNAPLKVHPWYWSDHPLVRKFQHTELAIAA